MKSGRIAIIEQFIKDGICYMFGNPGTVEQGFLDIIKDYPKLKYILSLQESIAVGIADGYARKTKRATLVQLHTGVGLGNGIGMIYQAMRGHAPLVVIAGESGVMYDSMDAQMACDLVGMAKPVTKWATRILDNRSILRVMRRAIKIASTPPMGPVFVSLPMDVLDAECVEEVVPTPRLNTSTFVDDKTLEGVANILLSAENPMIIMGDGIAFSGAQNALSELSALVGCQVWGADSSEVNIDTSSANFKGLLGHMFGYHSKPITSSADAVLICGTYVLPEVFPELESIFKNNAKIVHIDLEAYEIAKNFPVDIGIVSDPKTTLEKLIAVIKSNSTEQQKSAAEERQRTLTAHKESEIQEQKQKDEQLIQQFPMHPALFMKTLAEHIPEDTIIFDEALTASPELNRYIPPAKPGQFFQTRGGSLGVGIPGAIGIKIADPGKTVIGLTGDGGSMYTIQALWTAAHHNIGTKFIICNNHSYRLLKLNISAYWKERDIPQHEYPEMFSITNPDLDFVTISQGLGVPAVKVEKPEDIEPAIKNMLNADGPFLIDLYVETEADHHKVSCKCGQ